MYCDLENTFSVCALYCFKPVVGSIFIA